jgi:hypothetical protein
MRAGARRGARARAAKFPHGFPLFLSETLSFPIKQYCVSTTFLCKKGSVIQIVVFDNWGYNNDIYFVL